MLELKTILAAIRELTPEELELVRQAVDAEKDKIAPTTPAKQRIFDLHPGAMWMSDDFDDPLPDEFWLGEDA